MSFWQLQDGTEAATTTSFESGGGEIAPIPNNTALIAAIEEAKWSSYESEDYINLKWRVMRPAEYANRVIFHKLKVFSAKQGDKAKQMLRAIDANCGGKLSKLSAAPQDMDLMTALVGKPMAIKVQVWEMNDKKGNWISAVSPAKQQAPVAQASAPQAQARPQQRTVTPPQNVAPVYDPLDDDSIPF